MALEGLVKEMTDKCCNTCRFYKYKMVTDPFQKIYDPRIWCCTNDKSDAYGERVRYGDSCGEWRGYE